jgi:poly(A) polymerase
MYNFLKKIFKSTKKLTLKERSFLSIYNNTEVSKIFDAISNFNETSEIRYVGGCVRKILNHEEVDDIDLAVNLNPDEVKECLQSNNIKFFETGIKHGTITANLGLKNFEITSLREDVDTDGRHAKVKYTKEWQQDSLRRDFTINSIYADKQGNLFDPNGGTKHLEEGRVKFIGDPNKRIQEDYLRILRYIRFFLSYSKQSHDLSLQKTIKQNIAGIVNLSKERLISELKKIVLSKNFFKISEDPFSMEILETIFPQLVNLNNLGKLNEYSKSLLKRKSFVFLISYLIIDETDNTNYFLFKYNFSNENKKRIKFLFDNYNLFSEKDYFNKKNLQRIYYFNDKSYVIDLLDLKILNSKVAPKKIIELKKYFEKFEKPIFPLKAKDLLDQYNAKEGKEFGQKIKLLENIWLNNSFKLSKKEIDEVFKN